MKPSLVSHRMALWMAFSAVAGPPTPANDGFAGRFRLQGNAFSVSTTNFGATREPGEPLHAGVAGGHSLWWRWEAPADGEVRITTDGSETDTLLAVYTGSDLRLLREVVSNDDHGLAVTSKVRFTAVKGTSYAIAVDSSGGDDRAAVGRILLGLEFIPEPILRPVNDGFARPARLPWSPGILEVEATNRNATRELGEPDPARGMGDASVWWEWTPESSEVVQLSTAGSDFDTVLAVYTGWSLDSLSVVARSDDVDSASGVLTSLLTWAPVAGRRYLIAVDGFDGATGRIRLSLGPWRPRAMDVQWADGVFQFRVPGVSGTPVTLESSSDPRCCWSPIPGWGIEGGIGTFMEPMSMQTPRRFFRVVPKP